MNPKTQTQTHTPELLAALHDLLGALQMARTVKAPAGHYDEDVYYNGIDFAPQVDLARELLDKIQTQE